MKLGFVCTNFNNAGFTRQAVDTLLSNRGHEVVIVVVDNCSIAEDVTRLRELTEEHAEVRLMLLEKNVGYFAGLNSGIRYLRENFPDVLHVVIGNNDLIFGEEFIASIVQQLPNLEKYPVLSPDIVTLDGVHQNPHVIAGISWIRELLYDLYYANYHLAVVMHQTARLTRRITGRGDEAHWQVPRCIYQGYGSCYILGPCFFNSFAELWAPTFLFGEEYFLSKQLSDRGMTICYEPSITVQHCCNAAISKMARKEKWKHARVAHGVYRTYVKILAR